MCIRTLKFWTNIVFKPEITKYFDGVNILDYILTLNLIQVKSTFAFKFLTEMWGQTLIMGISGFNTCKIMNSNRKYGRDGFTWYDRAESRMYNTNVHHGYVTRAFPVLSGVELSVRRRSLFFNCHPPTSLPLAFSVHCALTLTMQ
jgi:hypothetical protein